MALWLVAVCGDRRASMKLSWFHMMSISTSCSSHVSFERSGSTWTNFQTQCNLWKRKKTPVSYKLSAASRINSRFCLCLIPKLSKLMAQPDCCCRLTQAEINGMLSRSIKHGQNPSRSCRSPVSTRMLLLQRSNKAGHGAFAWHWRSSASSTSSQCNMFKSLVETVETPCPHIDVQICCCFCFCFNPWKATPRYSKFKKIPPIILYSACLVTAAVTWKFSHLSHTLSPVATGHGKCMNLSQTISKNHWLLGTGYEWSWTWDCWLSRSIKHGQNPSRSCRSPVSTRMLLLQRSNSQLLLSLDLEDMNGHGHGIAGCLDLSNTAKIQAGVAGHQFQPECYCYSGLIKQAMEHLLGIGAALLRQHRLNATCSNRLLKPLKPHAHMKVVLNKSSQEPPFRKSFANLSPPFAVPWGLHFPKSRIRIRNQIYGIKQNRLQTIQ